MRNMFFIGLDLGQTQDYTAICVVEMLTTQTTKRPTDQLTSRPRKEFRIRHLQRFPLGTPYPAIVRSVVALAKSLNKGGLVVDATGVGRPVVDLLRAEHVYPTEVIIHGGDTTTHEGSIWRVPKRDLISTLTVAFQTGNLKIASALPDAKTLIDELLNFKVKINLKTAHDSYEAWRDGQHDDLVLCVALACWAGNNNISLCLDDWVFY